MKYTKQLNRAIQARDTARALYVVTGWENLPKTIGFWDRRIAKYSRAAK